MLVFEVIDVVGELQELLLGHLKKHRRRTVGQLQMSFAKRLDTATLLKVIHTMWLQGMVSITLGEKTVATMDHFSLDARHMIVFNQNTFMSREFETKETFDYGSVSDTEIDEESMHRSHAMTVKDAQEHSYVMEESEDAVNVN